MRTTAIAVTGIIDGRKAEEVLSVWATMSSERGGGPTQLLTGESVKDFQGLDFVSLETLSDLFEELDWELCIEELAQFVEIEALS